MSIPHSGRQGHEAATPAVSVSWIADSNNEIPPRSEWHVAALSSVRDVENLLDALENQNEINKQELIVLGNASFLVGWETEYPNWEPRFSPDCAVSQRHHVIAGDRIGN